MIIKLTNGVLAFADNYNEYESDLIEIGKKYDIKKTKIFTNTKMGKTIFNYIGYFG
ncbi:MULTISPECIES: hypothetical protein [Psychrilyobacter]|uniref:hypothetical protein n=1 Tax=Psychrilyobacter TaxID=623282 RepID=UPI0013140F63|nr:MULTISPECIES: hypothetical protein [Psychrilyobacter]MCS5422212.1 hypothetical protein [Psychrilyobacter sp. S5]NDI77140.1 hypothetical protein [Psychrilyobacter piezotolerans]